MRINLVKNKKILISRQHHINILINMLLMKRQVKIYQIRHSVKGIFSYFNMVFIVCDSIFTFLKIISCF